MEKTGKKLDLENIPEELKKLKLWVLWRSEDNPGKEKPTKIPYQPNGERAKVNDSASWYEFDEIIDAYDNGSYDGIGFVFSEEDDFIGIDFDNVISDDMTIDQDAKEWIEKFDSYTEYSQSRKGVHIIVRGNLSGHRRKKGNYEMYDSGRYFVFTGDLYNEHIKTIKQQQSIIDEFYREVIDNRDSLARDITGTARYEFNEANQWSDDEIQKKLKKAANADKYQKLFSGDISDYPSQSEADLGLCRLISFYTNNPGQIDRIFRQSKLMRQKWDENHGEQTYGAMTIEKALLPMDIDDKESSYSQQEDDGLLALLTNLEVIGELEDGKVLFFSRDTRATRIIKLSQLKEIDIIQMTGQILPERLEPIQNEIAIKARKNQLCRLIKQGQGIWKHDDGLLIVNGKEAIIWRDISNRTSIEYPIFQDYLFEFESQKWLNLDVYEETDPLATFNRIQDLLKQWNWNSKHNLLIATAGIFATPFQTIWPWKPHFYILGRRGTGKTTFNEFMQSLYGGLSLKYEGSVTEAGLRQSLRNGSYCVSLDEFEKAGVDNRSAILNLLRVSSKGGIIPRGTPNGKVIEFRINNIVWLLSIESALREAADVSRFISLQLNPLENKKLILPEQEEIDILSQQIICTGLKHYKQYLSTRDKIISDYEGQLDRRVLENYAVPLSIIEVLTRVNALDMLKDIEQDIGTQEVTEDEIQLLETILNSRVYINTGGLYNNHLSIGELIEKALNNAQFNRELQQYGISVTQSKGEQVVAFQPQEVSRKLLWNTKWSGLGIGDLLGRLKGATADVTLKLSGRNQRMVTIPIDIVLDKESDDLDL